jgi:hypothetical protein
LKETVDNKIKEFLEYIVFKPTTPESKRDNKFFQSGPPSSQANANVDIETLLMQTTIKTEVTEIAKLPGHFFHHGSITQTTFQIPKPEKEEKFSYIKSSDPLIEELREFLGDF